MHILAEFYLSCFGYHYKKNRTWNKILLFDVDLILFQVSILLDFFAPFFRYCCFQGPCLDFETWPAPHKWNGQHIGSYLTIKCHCSKWPQWSHPAWHSWPYFGISAIWQTFHGFRCSRRTPLFFFPNIIEKKRITIYYFQILNSSPKWKPKKHYICGMCHSKTVGWSISLGGFVEHKHGNFEE